MQNAGTLWKKFCAEKDIPADTPYEAWAFGGAPDELAELVLRGIKTATSSGYDLYFADGEEPPVVGEYSVLLNSRNEAVCILRTTKLTVLPFDEVGADHAYREGEGDRSLSYWRAVHESFFSEEFRSSGLVFTAKSRILCEEFEIVYK